MNIDKDTLHSLSKFSSKFAILIGPGLMVNEFAFHKGIYGGGISNIYDLLLLLIWSALYSLPYYVCILLILFWFGIGSKEEIDKSADDPDFFEEAIPLLFILMVVNYVLFKIMSSMNWLSISVKYGILQSTALLVVSVIITCIISFPTGKLYYFLLKKFMRKIRKAVNERSIN